eukprot:2237497-Heterocapsa_arctica.AAC.1
MLEQIIIFTMSDVMVQGGAKPMTVSGLTKDKLFKNKRGNEMPAEEAGGALTGPGLLLRAGRAHSSCPRQPGEHILDAPGARTARTPAALASARRPAVRV